MQGRASHPIPARATRRLGAAAWHGLALIWLSVLCLAPLGAAPRYVKPLDAYFKETWTTRDGLPHNLVHKIVQTPEGYLWFATWEGLARYNGLEFRIFDRGSVSELRDNGIRALRPALDGGLWLGTSRGGVSRLAADGSWITLTRAQGLAQDEVMDVLEDREGRLWVATESAGVTRIDGSQVVQYGRSGGLPSEVIYEVIQDHAGTIWVATAEGLARFEGTRFRGFGSADGLPAGQIFSVVSTVRGALYVGTERGIYQRDGERFGPLHPDLPTDNILRLLADRDGGLWIGTVNGGLYRFSVHGVEQLTSLLGLPNNRVSALFEDREGSIWVGTNGGLMRLRDAPFTTFSTEHGLPDDYVRSVISDEDEQLWIGTSRGLGVRKDGRFEAITRADGLPADSILSLGRGREGGIWIGTYSKGAVYWRGGVQRVYGAAQGLVGNQVRAVLESRDGRVWFGTTRGLARLDARGLRNFTIADGLPRDFIISLHEDRQGRIWAGTSNGLVEMRGDTVHVHDLTSLDDAQDVFGFHESDDGSLWMATDRGLIRYRNGALNLIGRRQGLPVETIFQVIADDNGQFWLTSNRGILRAARTGLEAVVEGHQPAATFEVYGESDGLASAQNNGGSGPVAWRTRDGRLWFGTAKGLAMTDPAKLADFVREAPPVVIEEVLVDDRPMPPASTLALPAGTRKLELRFAGLSFLMPGKMRYRYRLEGFDPDWVERGTLRFAQFTNLAPGDYRFRVVASNAEGEWGQTEAQVAIRIAPLLVQRREFWFLFGLVFLGVFYALYRWRVHRLEHGQHRLRELVERSTADLRAQTERLTRADREKSLLLERLQQQSEAFERQAREDSLTGLVNRRSFDEALAREFARAQRSGRPLSIALGDLDHFKLINDNYSHAAGDMALRAVANLIRDTCRTMDVTARWGGEEFAMLFPETSREEAHRICERLREGVEKIDVSAFAPGHRITISIGVTDHFGLGHHEKMISRADAKLYEAKDAGRNRVCS